MTGGSSKVFAIDINRLIRCVALGAALAGCGGGSQAPAASATEPPVAPVAVAVPVVPAFDLAVGKPEKLGLVTITVVEANAGGATLSIDEEGEIEELRLVANGTGWTRTHRVELVSASPQSASIRIGRVTGAPLGSPRQLTLARGAAADLADGWKLRFVAHGHKDVDADGPPSPLIMVVEYVPPSGPPIEDSNHLYPPEESTWRWRDWEFTLGEYDYNTTVAVSAQRLELE